MNGEIKQEFSVDRLKRLVSASVTGRGDEIYLSLEGGGVWLTPDEVIELRTQLFHAITAAYALQAE